jgi:alpha-aminoadipate/glutamate carrier protein LysW
MSSALLSNKEGFFIVNDRDKRRTVMPNITCPECFAETTLASEVEVGEIVVCPDCGVDLEVISLQPPQVDLAPMEEEDWGE